MNKLSFACAALAVVLVAVSGCKESATKPPASTAEQGSGAPNAEGGVSFSKKALPVGQKIKETEKMQMNMSMTVDMSALGGKPETTKISNQESMVRQSEVLALNKDAPTKLKVTYSEKHEIAVEEGKEKKTTSPVSGKSYLVERKGDQVVVTGADGAKVSDEELAVVQADHKELGQPDTVSSSLHGKTIKPGDEVPGLAAVIESELTQGAAEEVGADAKVSGVQVKFREQKNGVGLFDVAVIFTQAEGPMTIRMDLKGTLGVRTADTQPAELTLKGPVAIDLGEPDPSAPPMKITGSGDMSLSLTQSYL